MAGVASVARITKPYKLVSREFHPEDTVIRVLDTAIGDGSLTVMAGPCSVESRDQMLETAEFVAAHGREILRGGAFKPRTSPYSFQGLGVEGLRYLAEARERTGMPVITEVMEPARSTSSRSTPTSSRSAPGTCRTSRCCSPAAGPGAP